jgi:DNA-binding Lrp family transcriptional regulator
MSSAFVLIECKDAFVQNVISDLAKIGPEMVYQITGSQYDIILKIHENSKEDLKGKVAQIMQLPHIVNTLTLIVLS